MITALFYLQYHSVRNRLATRLKRLKQPKYLIGAIAGGLYLYFYFFRYLFRSYALAGSPEANLTIPAEHQALIESIGALALFIIMLFSWIIPHERAALTFTEAEIAFLFPAPVTRRMLVHFKLIRSQFRIFFSALLLTLISRRFGGNVWIHALGWWLILSTLSLHFLGASFARMLLLDHGISNRLRRLLVLALALAMAGGVWFWAKNSLPVLTSADTSNVNSLMNYAERLLTAVPALYLLFPFRLIARPFLAPDTGAFFVALVPALLLLLLHYLWVICSDVAFEETSLNASQKLAERIAAVRAGNWQSVRKNLKGRRAWFRLAPTGSQAIALLWKNLIGIGQVFSPRLWIVLAIILVALVAGFGHTGPGQNISMLAAIIVAFVLAYSMLLGPQFLRLDFRRDLPQADILKTFPLRGWQIALGEILAPVAVLAGLQWLLLLVGSVLVWFLPGKHIGLELAIGLSAAIVLPVMDFLLLLIPNAAVLLFPSWIQTGKDSPRGIEATGQRLIFAVGQLLVLLLALVPVALAFAAVYFPLKFIIGLVAPVPVASLAAAIVLAAEAGFGVLLLGKLFERFDVTEETGS